MPLVVNLEQIQLCRLRRLNDIWDANNVCARRERQNQTQNLGGPVFSDIRTLRH